MTKEFPRGFRGFSVVLVLVLGFVSAVFLSFLSIVVACLFGWVLKAADSYHYRWTGGSPAHTSFQKLLASVTLSIGVFLANLLVWQKAKPAIFFSLASLAAFFAGWLAATLQEFRQSAKRNQQRV